MRRQLAELLSTSQPISRTRASSTAPQPSVSLRSEWTLALCDRTALRLSFSTDCFIGAWSVCSCAARMPLAGTVPPVWDHRDSHAPTSLLATTLPHWPVPVRWRRLDRLWRRAEKVGTAELAAALHTTATHSTTQPLTQPVQPATPSSTRTAAPTPVACPLSSALWAMAGCTLRSAVLSPRPRDVDWTDSPPPQSYCVSTPPCLLHAGSWRALLTATARPRPFQRRLPSSPSCCRCRLRRIACVRAVWSACSKQWQR